MRHLYRVGLILLPIVVLALAGCSSGSSSNQAADPFTTSGSSTGGATQNSGSANFSLTLLPGSATAHSNEDSIVTATLKDSSSNALANQTVHFSISAGPATAVTTAVQTDANGVALAFIRTGSTSVTTNVIVQGSASVNNTSVVGYGNIQVLPGNAGNGASLALSVPSYSVRPNEELLVSATAKDSSGSPLPNQVVNFSVTALPAVMVTGSATTDSHGVATALVRAGNPTGVANIVVQAETTVNASQVTAVIPFQIIPATTAAQSFALTLTPSKSEVNNNEQFTVTALLKDAGGNPVVNQPVSFTVAAGEASVVTATVNTDSNGRAITGVQALNPAATSSVILQASSTIGGTQISALAAVQVNVLPNSQAPLRMTLTSDKASVGIDGEVLLTATLTDAQTPPVPVQNQPVTFSIVAGPATVIAPAVVNTDSFGKAVCRLKSGSVNSSSSIIAQASASVLGATANAYQTIQVVRQNSMIINFTTSKLPTDPNGTLNSLPVSVPWDATLLRYGAVQLVPFNVLDGNGVPMPNVDVDISVYSSLGVASPSFTPQSPIRTDDHGLGIFNVAVAMDVPVDPGTSISDAIVYVATATVNGVSLRSYGGFVISISREKKP
jgi:hypothetical protein